MKFDLPRRELGIVIVDDSKELIDVYEKHFKAAGLRIVAKFSSGEDLLSYATSDKSTIADSIVLLDHKMLEMEGLETARQLRRLNPNQRIILTVGETSSIPKIDEDLFDDNISKPFTISELVAAIEKVSSPIRLKGSRIFSDPEEIENLLKDIISDCTDKLCSIRNPSTIISGVHMPGHTSAYLTAISKGLNVFVVTEITRENLAYCKQLMMNRGVQLRHLKGLLPNFGVYDEKHLTEMIQAPNDSMPFGHVMYTNLQSNVKRSQFMFDFTWSIATPAEGIIKELESQVHETSPAVLAGREEIELARITLIRNSRSFVYASISSDLLPNLMKSGLREAHVDAVSRDIQCLLITEITEENLESCRRLIEIGIEIRHLPNVKGAFSLNEQEAMSFAAMDDPKKGLQSKTFYSIYPEFVNQHKSIFNALWNIAIPAAQTIKEIEVQKEALDSDSNYESKLVDTVLIDSSRTKLETNPTDLFMAIDADWKILFVNNSEGIKLAPKVAGIDRIEDLVGKNCWKAFPHYLGTSIEENFRAAMERRETRHWKIRSKVSGRLVECVAYPAVSGIGVLAVDVEARKQVHPSVSK